MSDDTLPLETERRTIPKSADRGEWLAARRGWFNASAAAVLFDRHPFMTAGDYATTKLTGLETEETRAMKRGVRLEDVIANWWSDENDVALYEPAVLYIAGRMMATVDRMMQLDAVGNGVPVEIKTTAHHAPVPEPHWLDQCQAIMACVGAPELALVWFDSSLDIRHQRITADVNLQRTMLARAERFMAAIDLGFAPDWVMLSAENVAAIYDKPADMIDLDDDGLELVRTYDMVRTVRLEAEKEEAEIKDRLARLLLDKEAAGYDGIPILTWKSVRVGQTFDTKGFRDDHPDLYAEYLIDKPPQRRFHLLIGNTT